MVHTLLQANGTPGLQMLESNVMVGPETSSRPLGVLGPRPPACTPVPTWLQRPRSSPLVV